MLSFAREFPEAKRRQSDRSGAGRATPGGHRRPFWRRSERLSNVLPPSKPPRDAAGGGSQTSRLRGRRREAATAVAIIPFNTLFVGVRTAHWVAEASGKMAAGDVTTARLRGRCNGGCRGCELREKKKSGSSGMEEKKKPVENVHKGYSKKVI
jgi:hypothetical protein